MPIPLTVEEEAAVRRKVAARQAQGKSTWLLRFWHSKIGEDLCHGRVWEGGVDLSQ